MGAIGDAYATVAQLKSDLGIPDSQTAQHATYQRKLDSASMDINRWCHRQFNRDEVASARTYYAGVSGIDVDDFYDDASLVVTPYIGEVAQTAWTANTYDLEPANGIVDGIPGWPYQRIVYGSWLSGGSWFWNRYRIQVTAKWGWSAVPDNVVTACIMLAASDLKAKDAPFGVAGFGDYAVRIRQNPMAAEKLAAYRHPDAVLMAAS